MKSSGMWYVYCFLDWNEFLIVDMSNVNNKLSTNENIKRNKKIWLTI